MSDVQFHTTRMGQRFYEVTMPRLVEEVAKLNERLAALAEALERAKGMSAVVPGESHRPNGGAEPV